MEEKVPKIRFTGFEEQWKKRKLGEVGGAFQYGLNASAIQYDGRHKYIRITDIDDCSRQFSYKDLSSPNVNPNELAEYKLSVNDIVFARTGASVGKTYMYNADDGDVFFAGFLIRTNINTNYDVEFVFQNTLTDSYEKFIKETSQRSGQPGVNAKEYSEYTLMCPSLSEQKTIGYFLKNIDRHIYLHQQKLDRLKTLKKACLEKMFPKEGEAVPEIRFKGFEGPWQKKTFGSIVEKYVDPVATPKTGYYRLGIKSHAKGTFHNYVEKGQELETAQMHRVAKEKFIVNITFAWEHAVAITTESDEGKLVSHRFPQFTFHNDMFPDFFRYVISNEKFRHHLWLSSPGGAGRNRVLKIEEMLAYNMIIPSKEEQKQIAEYLGRIDNLIDLTQQKLDKLKNLKKALLDRMFV